MKDRNYCIITGILVNKAKNANNIDIKRPVFDFEIVDFNEQGEPYFSVVPVLFSDAVLSKIATGFYIGEIFIISGKLREDNAIGLYLEAESIARIQSKSNKDKDLTLGRIILLSLTQRFNLANIVGFVDNKKNTISILRDTYSRGDLKEEDNIPLVFDKDVSYCGNAVCIGTLRKQDKNNYLALYVRDLIPILE